MNRWFTLACMMLIGACALTQAQTLQITSTNGFGPFTSGTALVNTFTVTGYPSGAVADSVTWQIVNKDGPAGALRVVRSMQTATPSWQTTMGDLPFLPTPQLNATASYVLNGQRITRQVTKSIYMVPPTITWTSTNNWAGIPVGSAFTGRYGISGCPPGTTRIVLYLHPIFGANLDSVVRTGTNLDTATIQYKTTSHVGALSIQAVITFPGSPTGGYLTAKAIPDILPPVKVKASLGFGPFVSGRDAFNTFTIDSTLGAYTTATFTYSVNGRYGAVYSVGKQTSQWASGTDRFQITSNMGDLPPYSTLRVDMVNLSGNVAASQTVPINIARPIAPPLFTLRRQPPLVFNSHGSDSIVLDTLPARTMKAKLSLLSPSGQLIKDTTTQAGSFGFLTRASLRFDGGSLPLFTHTLRAEFWSDYNLNPTEFDYYFDVRDTAVPYIFATSWGPFVQTDSATFSLGITDLRAPSSTVQNRIGWFEIIDTSNGAVLMRSATIALDTVKRRDSLWYTDSLGNRALVETALLPVNAGVQFVDVGLNASDTAFKNITHHPILMVERPGVLTASAGYGPFIAGRKAPNTFRIDSLPDNTESVEFVVTGTENPSDVDSLLLTQIVGNSAQFTTDMGMLPVNARLRVTVVTSTGPDEGTSIIRFLYTVPDTLFMKPSLKFDTLTFAWQTSAAGGQTQITGPRVIPDTFTISRPPAQTETITVATFDLQGNRIDSTSFAVPYRVRFDSSLSVKVPFAFTAFSTSRIEFRLFSSGGIPNGILTTRPITVTKAPFSLAAKRYTARSATLDTVSVHQGSAEQMDMTTRVLLQGGSNYGFAPNVVIDSTRIRFLTCNGTRVDSLLPKPASSNPASNIVSDTVFTVTPLPLITTRAEVTIYSKMLTLPAKGFTYSDTVRIVPGPVVFAPLRGDFPTYRVNDTTKNALYNPYTLSQLPLIDSIVQMRVMNKNGQVVASYPTKIPQRDSVNYVINMDSSVFTPSGSPYRIAAQANYTVCTQQRTYAFGVDTFTVTRVLPDPSNKNFVWSSAGWGPFKQGKGRMSQFLASLQPTNYITSQDTISDDQLTVTLSAVTAGKDTVEAVFATTSSTVPKKGTVPDVWRVPTPSWQIGGFNVGTWFKMQVDWTKIRTTGNVHQNTWTYYFPMTYLPFPPQPIISSSGWGPYEQSVTAGSAGTKTMQNTTTVTDSVGSDIISKVAVWMLDYQGKRLDSLNMTAGAKLDTGINLVQLFTLPNYDMAQFPWPNVARDNKLVTMKVGYYFIGNSALAQSQTQTIEIDPRAYWLNNSIVTATSVTGNVINLTVKIPLPTPSFTTSLPLIGSLPFTTANVDGKLYLQHQVTYNTGTKQFAFQSSDAQPSNTFKWSPALSGLFMSGSYSATAADSATDAEFTALRHFEPDEDGNPNQNLRERSLVQASLKGSLTGLFNFLKAVLEVAKVIESGATDGIITFTPTFGLALGSEQMMNVNLGVEESDQMTHAGTVPSMSSASTEDQDEYPTALSTGFSIDISVGGEIGLALDFFGVGLSFDRQTTITWGSAYTGPLSNVTATTFPFGGNERLYVDIDASLLWGLITIELYRGLMLSSHSPQGTPAFEVFKESWSSIFKSSKWYEPKGGGIETPQADSTLFKRTPLPNETPVYYSRPSVDANDSAVVVAWTEHSLRGRDGTLMLGRVNKDSMTFGASTIVTTGRNAIHDPQAKLLDNEGTTLVVWNQNSNDASVMGAPLMSPQVIQDMLSGEQLFGSIVSANGEVITRFEFSSDDASFSNSIDGKAAVAVSDDSSMAVIAWPVKRQSDTSSDIMAVVLRHQNNRWEIADKTIVASTPGYDAMVQVAPYGARDFMLVWKHDTNADRPGADVMFSRYESSWSPTSVLLADNADRRLQTMAIDGTREGVVLAVATEATSDSGANELHLDQYVFVDEHWVGPSTLELDGAYATMGDLDVSVNDDGQALFVADVTYPSDNGTTRRMTYTYTASKELQKLIPEKNSATLYEADKRVWHMSGDIGPDDVMYMATQEMDPVRGNTQHYANGIQVGSNRVNTVLRALRLEGGKLVTVPFKGQTITAVDDQIEKNLRYPCMLYAPYPNPTSGDAMVTFAVQTKTNVHVDVVDVTGSLMATLVDNDLADGVYDVAIPVSHWPQGCYTIRMLTSTGQLMSKSFTVVR